MGSCAIISGVEKCVYTQVSCGVDNVCTKYSCDPLHGCITTNLCEDNDPCTDDLCDMSNGQCSHTPHACKTSLPCHTAVCDFMRGCVAVPVNCSAMGNVSVLLDNCHYAICSSTIGCQAAVIPGTLNSCGFCNAPGVCVAKVEVAEAETVAIAVISGALLAGVTAFTIAALAVKKSSAKVLLKFDEEDIVGSSNPLFDRHSSPENPVSEIDISEVDYVPIEK